MYEEAGLFGHRKEDCEEQSGLVFRSSADWLKLRFQVLNKSDGGVDVEEV
jgi:hypothetical protein